MTWMIPSEATQLRRQVGGSCNRDKRCRAGVSDRERSLPPPSQADAVDGSLDQPRRYRGVDGCYAATLMTWADPLAVAQAIGPRCDFPGELAAQHPRPTSGNHRARPAASLLARSAGCDPGDSVEAEIEGVGVLHNTVGGMFCPGHTGRSVGLEVPRRLDVRPGRGCDAACLVAGEGAQRAREDVWLAVQRRPEHPGAPWP